MATLRTIRKRIVSVRNTQKITKAMKMVAASKLRRAQQTLMGNRPYTNKYKELLRSLLASSENEKAAHPLFVAHESVKKVLLLVFSTNRGLCGGFNSNLLRQVEQLRRDFVARAIDCKLEVIGRKARDYFKARHIEVSNVHLSWADALPLTEATQLVTDLSRRYLAGEFDECFIVYNGFVSAMTQNLTRERLLPVKVEDDQPPAYGIDYLYEPPKQKLLEVLVPRFLAHTIYRAHLESLTAELAARMAAMENATSNAVEMIQALTLQFNRVRQAAITKELLDIVNGAEALKH